MPCYDIFLLTKLRRHISVFGHWLMFFFLSSFSFLTEMHWIYWKRPLSQKQPQPWRPQLPHFLSPHQQLLLRPLAADPTYLLCLYQGNLEPLWADTLQHLQHLIQTSFWLAASSGLKVLIVKDIFIFDNCIHQVSDVSDVSCPVPSSLPRLLSVAENLNFFRLLMFSSLLRALLQRSLPRMCVVWLLRG